MRQTEHENEILQFAAAIFAVLFTTGFSAEDHRLDLFTEGGAPVGPPALKILVNSGYAVGYSEELKYPPWVAYRLGNRRSGDSTKRERPVRFEVDFRTQARVTHEDYVRNWEGQTWDRGHMAPNSAMEGQYGQLAHFETYLITNIIPQNSQLNSGLWARLEAEIRDVISQDDTPNREVTDVWVMLRPNFRGGPDTAMAFGRRCADSLVHGHRVSQRRLFTTAF